jgi:hypothetical protein
VNELCQFPTNKLSQGVAKLPFVDKELLLSATKTVETELTVKQLLAIPMYTTLKLQLHKPQVIRSI